MNDKNAQYLWNFQFFAYFFLKKIGLPGLATGGGGALIIGNEATRINGPFKSSPTSILFDEPHLFSFT